MRYVFLDVDGVLNSDYTKDYVLGFIALDHRNISIFADLMRQIYTLYGKEQVKLILSSSWRAGRDRFGNFKAGDAFRTTLDEFLAKENILIDDETPQILDGGRGHEIMQYLLDEYRKGRSVDGYLVLDDHYFLDFKSLFITRHWVQSQCRTSAGTGGLLPKHIKPALAAIARPMNEDELELLQHFSLDGFF